MTHDIRRSADDFWPLRMSGMLSDAHDVRARKEALGARSGAVDFAEIRGILRLYASDMKRAAADAMPNGDLWKEVSRRLPKN